MFAVTSGNAGRAHGTASTIRTLGPGDVFGEIAVPLSAACAPRTVVATTPMKLVMLFNSELARLDREVPEVADKLRATVAERLGAA